MKYLHLIRAALLRSKTRTMLTLLSVVAAFLLFGMLDSVRVAFASGGGVAGAERLVVSSRLSITQTLPYRLLPQIEAVPGVEKVVYANWFGGIYREPKNFFANFAIGPDYFELYPEMHVPPEQLAAYQADRTGAVIGASLAERFDWKIGDTIPLQATIFPKDGSNDWAFTLRAVFRVDEPEMAGLENQMMFHWDYFNESNDYMRDQIGWFMIDLENIDQASQVANAIDAISANSDHETKTQTEQAWNQAFMQQFADIGLIVTAIMAAVFFTLLLLTGNTMAQAVRERIPELAVLKTIGFSDRTVLALVLVESLLLILIGGLIGMGLSAAAMPAISAASGGAIALPGVPTQTWLTGLGLMLAIGLIVGALPALRAMRLNIVDALAGR